MGDQNLVVKGSTPDHGPAAATTAMSDASTRYWSRVGFSIELPPGWLVAQEDVTGKDAVQDAREEFALWCDVWLSTLNADDVAHFRWAEEQGPDRLVMLMRQPKTRKRAGRALSLLLRVEDERREIGRAEMLGTRIGLMRAQNSEPHLAALDVRRFRLPRDLGPLDFYKAAKSNPRGGGRGPRVGRTFAIDGVDAVRAYRDFGMYRPRSETWPKYLDHYFCAGRDGWVIECGCERSQFDKYRENLFGIVYSFTRAGPTAAVARA